MASLINIYKDMKALYAKYPELIAEQDIIKQAASIKAAHTRMAIKAACDAAKVKAVAFFMERYGNMERMPGTHIVVTHKGCYIKTGAFKLKAGEVVVLLYKANKTLHHRVIEYSLIIP